MNKKQMEEEFISKVYNLILDKETKEDERNILLDFKNRTERENFEENVEKLSNRLRKLAIEKCKNGETLSSGVGSLYTSISSKGLFKKELARGIIAGSIMWRM